MTPTRRENCGIAARGMRIVRDYSSQIIGLGNPWFGQFAYQRVSTDAPDGKEGERNSRLKKFYQWGEYQLNDC